MRSSLRNGANRSSISSPAQADIDNWIDNLTDYQFAGMRERAANTFVEGKRDPTTASDYAA